MAKITVKRIVPMYTVVTERFKQELEAGSLHELKMIDDQIIAVNTQIKQLQGKFGLLMNQASPFSQEQTSQAVNELTARLEQLQHFKQNMIASFDEMKKRPLGFQIQTGIIENYVELNPGDNIKQVFERCRIVVKDDVIQEIVD